MDGETGETYDDIPLPAGELGSAITEAFENTESEVVLYVQLDVTKVKSILGIHG
jgi:hypothetical protein